MLNKNFAILFVLTSFFLSAGPKKELDILLIGESGSGKSTLINVFYNHIKGKKFEDPRDIIIPLRYREERSQVNVEKYKKIHDRLKKYDSAATDKFRAYRLENDQFMVTFWDSPGLDEKSQTQLVDFLSKTPLNAVAIVFESRIDEKIIDILSRLLPKSALESILVMYSYGPSLSSYESKELDLELSNLFGMAGTSVVLPRYSFNSNVFFEEPRDVDNQNEETLFSLLWNRNQKTLERLLRETKSDGILSVVQIKRIKELRQKIEDAVQNLNRQFQLVEFHKTNLKILESKTGDCSEKIQSCKVEIEKLETDQAKMKKELRALEAELKQFVMKTDSDAYISYLNPWAVRLQRDYSLSEAEQARQKQLCQDWVGIYTAMPI